MENKENAKRLKEQGIDDEICQCEHSKGYHKSHSLDGHGGECELCNCKIFTWAKFVKYTKPTK